MLGIGVSAACGVSINNSRRPVAEVGAPALPSARKVWPQAFFVVPQFIKGIGDVTPVVMLDRNTVLLAHGDVVADDTRPAMISYDRRTGRHRVLATAPKGGVYHDVLKVALTDDEIIWIAGGDPSPQQIWAMPRTGGSMRLIAAPISGPETVDGMEVTKDEVIWWEEGEVYRVPLAGGIPQKSSIGKHRSIASWPWAYDEQSDDITNLVTSEKRDTGAVDGLFKRCGPTWCVGAARPEQNEITQVVVQRSDGTDRRVFPGQHRQRGLAAERFGFSDPPLVYGRSGGTTISSGWSSDSLGNVAVIYDRCTGKTALLDPPDVKASLSAGLQYDPGVIRIGADKSGTLLLWNALRERHAVMDLAGIPSGSCGDIR
ncbi:hypothetical protein [Streptosporangium sp. NBC_01469]|uniref:hypothetical protein n=1 Tax=Streptosporangium sp. NBC_01469 TaxID=2903898 RepID=UPI002E2B703C|nr:hypothetical protein [Streptosporangium sp. NBC_01469]